MAHILSMIQLGQSGGSTQPIEAPRRTPTGPWIPSNQELTAPKGFDLVLGFLGCRG